MLSIGQSAAAQDHDEIVEPDVSRRPDISRFASRLNHALGPVGAGLLLDMLDIATFGPLGLVLGLPLGGLAGYWMARSLRLDQAGVLFCTIGGAVYCAIPMTEFVPLATLVGACVRFQTLADDVEPEVGGAASLESTRWHSPHPSVD